jgi:hypothetical protein
VVIAKARRRRRDVPIQLNRSRTAFIPTLVIERITFGFLLGSSYCCRSTPKWHGLICRNDKIGCLLNIAEIVTGFGELQQRRQFGFLQNVCFIISLLWCFF